MVGLIPTGATKLRISSVVEHLAHIEKVVGSKPSYATISVVSNSDTSMILGISKFHFTIFSGNGL